MDEMTARVKERIAEGAEANGNFGQSWRESSASVGKADYDKYLRLWQANIKAARGLDKP